MRIRSVLRDLDDRFLRGVLYRIYFKLDITMNRVREERIDFPALVAVIPQSFGQEVAQRLQKALKSTDQVHFFGNLRTVYDRHSALYFENDRFELFPPNIAVLDFLQKCIDSPDEEVVLDYGGGAGTLLVYLQKLGFRRVYCYDNWSQLARSTAEPDYG